MPSFRLSVVQDGQRKRVETSLDEFHFFSLLVGSPGTEKFFRNTGTQLEVEGPLRVAPAITGSDAVTLGQLQAVETRVLTNEELLAIKCDEIVANRLLAAINRGEIERLQCELDYLESNLPVEQTLVSGLGGQTVFTFTQVQWRDDNSIPDVMVYLWDRKQIQDLNGLQVEAFRKLSNVQLEFSEIIPEGTKVTARMNDPNFVTSKPVEGFFRECIAGFNELELTVPNSEKYDIGTAKFTPYRNGLFMTDSPTVGPAIQRYAETSPTTFELGVASEVDDIFATYHYTNVPVYRVAFSGLTGTTFTVPTYVLGNRLRVFRNGALCNTLSKGPTSLQYSQNSTTEIQFVESLEGTDYVIVEFASVAPIWRDDLDGITGVDVNFSGGNVYTPGDKKLQVWLNGKLMLDDSKGIGELADRYEENGLNCIQMQEAIGPEDLVTAIYLP